MHLLAVLAASLATSSVALAALPRIGGINIAGLEFGCDVWGNCGTYVEPPTSQYAHFASKGANAFRIPLGWPYIQPSIGGALDAGFLSKLDKQVQAGLATGAYVILDLHAYGRYNSKVVGVDGPSSAQFANLWSQLANKYAGQSKIMFGLMNEPHDQPLQPWVAAVQAAVTAIRDAGATSQYILLPGNGWSHVEEMVRSSGPALMAVKDTANLLAFDVHQYLDSDGSGTQNTCTTDNVAVMKSLSSWLASVGRQAIVSETGTANNAGCIEKLSSQLSYVSSVSNTIAGFTAWSAGAFDSSYLLSLTPNGNSDNALATQAVFPYFPGKGVSQPVVVPSSSSKAVVVPSTTSKLVAVPTTSSIPAPTPVTSTPAAVVPKPVVTSAAPSPSRVTTGTLQKFTGAVGGVSAPAVSTGGRGFVVGTRSDFTSLSDALNYSCDMQVQLCQAAYNRGDRSFSMEACNTQGTACKAAASSARKRMIHLPISH